MCSRDDDPTTFDAPPRPPTCEAVIGKSPSPYGFMVVRCSQRVGLVTWTDHTGLTHRACRQHEAGVKHLYPVTAA